MEPKTNCLKCNTDIEDMQFCSDKKCKDCISGKCFSDTSYCNHCCPKKRKFLENNKMQNFLIGDRNE